MQLDVFCLKKTFQAVLTEYFPVQQPQVTLDKKREKTTQPTKVLL